MEIQALQPKEPNEDDTEFSSHTVEDLRLKISRISLAGPPVGCLKKKLLVLDINGLLADIVSSPGKGHKADKIIKREAIFKRPFLHDFLKFCFDNFEVSIWSSRQRKNVDQIVDYLLGDMEKKLLFFWDLSHCTKTDFKVPENRYKNLVFKDLRRLWQKYDPCLPWDKGYYNQSNTLLLDDSPYKGLLNPPYTSIFPHTFRHQNKDDNSLGKEGDLRKYINELANAEDMQKYVEKHPFGQECISETSKYWNYYWGIKNKYKTSMKNKYRYRRKFDYWNGRLYISKGRK